MTRACFLCGDRLVRDGSVPMWTDVFFVAFGRYFLVKVCNCCFAAHDLPDIWQSVKWMHEEECRDISQAP